MNAKVLRLRRGANDESALTDVTPQLEDVYDAFYLTVHEYKGGPAALAPRCGLNANTLQLKANPNVETHQPNLKDAVAVMVGACNYRVLHAMAAAVGHVALPVVQVAEGDVAERLAAIGAEVGDVFREATATIRDDRITANERRRMRKEVGEAIAALNGLLSAL